MKGEIAVTTALVLLLLTLGAEAKVRQWMTTLDVVCELSTCITDCISKGYTDGYCTPFDRKCASTKECKGDGGNSGIKGSGEAKQGGGAKIQLCVCVNYANFMGRKGGNWGGYDVGVGGSKSLFLEDEAMSPWYCR